MISVDLNFVGRSYFASPAPGDHLFLAVKGDKASDLIDTFSSLSVRGSHVSNAVQAHVDRCAATKRRNGFYKVDAKGKVYSAPLPASSQMARGLSALVANSQSNLVSVREVLPPHPAAISGDKNRCAFGMFAFRDLPPCVPIVLYDDGATVTLDGEDLDQTTAAAALRDYELEQRLGDKTVIFNGNPLISAATRINDVKGTKDEANCTLLAFLHVCASAPPRIMIAVVTLERTVHRGTQLQADYCGNYWVQRASHMRERNAELSSFESKIMGWLHDIK